MEIKWYIGTDVAQLKCSNINATPLLNINNIGMDIDRYRFF